MTDIDAVLAEGERLLFVYEDEPPTAMPSDAFVFWASKHAAALIAVARASSRLLQSEDDLRAAQSRLGGGA